MPGGASNDSTPARWMVSGAGSKTPLISVHTWLSDIAHDQGLAERLGDRAVYGVLRPADPETIPRRIEGWVEHVLEVIDELPIQAPYLLIGWSLGGMVALEVARTLRSRGIEVGYVGMVDSVLPKPRPRGKREALWFYLGEAAATDPAHRWGEIWWGVRRVISNRLERRRTRRSRKREQHGGRPVDADPYLRASKITYITYRPDRVDFPVSLFAAEETVARYQDPSLRWAAHLVGGWTLRVVPGGHFDVLDPPNVDVLARELAIQLARVDAAT